MHSVTITKVYINNKNKDGVLLKDKNGKPFWKVAIKTDKTGDDYYSCLAFREDDPILQLKEGDEKTIVLDESGGFKNFKLPTKYDIQEAKIEELNRRVSKLEGKSEPKKVGNTDVTYPSEPDINPDDIPF